MFSNDFIKPLLNHNQLSYKFRIMRILACMFHNKKGDPLLIATSPVLQTKNVIAYCHIIYYDYILQTFKNRTKFEKTILLQSNLVCVCTISKDYICYLFVRKSDLGLAFDGIRRITEYFGFSSNKSTGQNRIDNLHKKPVEYASIFEQFLICRQISLLKDQYLPLNQPASSKKKPIDAQIFNKFTHLSQQSDKKNIYKNQIIACELQKRYMRQKCKILKMAERFIKKGDQQLQDILQTDPEKEKYINQYRKNIIKAGIAVGSKRKKSRFGSISLMQFNQYNQDTTSYLSSYSSLESITKQQNTNNLIGNQSSTRQYDSKQQVQFMTESLKIDKQDVKFQKKNKKLGLQYVLNFDKEQLKIVKIKFLEKLELSLNNGKVKEVQQFGQLLVEANQASNFDLLSDMTSQTNQIQYEVKLLSPSWNDLKILSKRPSPKSIPIQFLKQQNVLQFKLSSLLGNKQKPILDYVIRKETFTSDKIPLLFIYTMQVSSNNIEFVFKYKLNEKFQKKLNDVEIAVTLSSGFVPVDCKTVPSAHSLRNNKVVWKTKEISWSSGKAKGKVILAFGSSNIHPKNIIKQIKLTMKCAGSLYQHLDIGMNCNTKNNQIQLQQQEQKNYQKAHQKILNNPLSEIDRTIIIEYKVAPNDSHKQ